MVYILNLFDIIEGREHDYARYLRRVQAILNRHDAKIVLYGRTRRVFMGNHEQEYCGVVSYPDMAALKRFTKDPEFVEIRPLRDESTTNYVLTAIEGFPTMEDAAVYLENPGS